MGQWLVASELFCIVVTCLFFEDGLAEEIQCPPGNRNSIGYTLPRKDIYLLPGEDLVMNCTLTKPEFNASKVYWKVLTLSGIHEANGSYVDVLDNRTSQLHLPSSEFPANKFRAACMTTEQKGQSICRNYVNVGEPPPMNVTINCTSFDLKNIYCEWNLPPENPAITDWKFQHWDNSNNSLQTCCPVVPKRPLTNCTCRSDAFCNDWKQSFSLEGKNGLGTGVSYNTFDQRQKVILSKIFGIKPRDVSNTTANITWDLFDCLSDPEKRKNWGVEIEYNISVRRNGLLQGSSVSIINEAFYLWTNLTPFLDYTVEIKRRVLVNGHRNLYGPSSHARFTTLPGVPIMSPKNVVGSLSTEEDSTLGNLTIYWKGIPHDFHGGNEFRYTVVLSSGNEYSTTRNETSNPHTTFHDLSMANNYTVVVKAINEIGEAKDASRVSIDFKTQGYTDVLNVEDVIVDDSSWIYMVRWKVSSRVKLVHYWCSGNKNTDGTVQCNEEGINAIEVNDADNFTHKLQHPKKEENYFFGVAILEPSRLGSIVWSTCTIPTSNKLQPPENLEASNKATTWVQLSWKPLACHQKAVGIIGFQVKIKNSKGEERYEVEGSNATSYKVEGLSPGTNHNFAIRTITHDASSGYSSSIPVWTEQESEKNDTVLFIVIPIVGFLLLMPIFLTIAWLKYKKFRTYVAKMINIHLPARLGDPIAPQNAAEHLAEPGLLCPTNDPGHLDHSASDMSEIPLLPTTKDAKIPSECEKIIPEMMSCSEITAQNYEPETGVTREEIRDQEKQLISYDSSDGMDYQKSFAQPANQHKQGSNDCRTAPSKSVRFFISEPQNSGCGLGYTKASFAVCPIDSEFEMEEYNHNSNLNDVIESTSLSACYKNANIQIIPEEALSQTTEFNCAPNSHTTDISALDKELIRCGLGEGLDYRHLSEIPVNQDVDCSVGYTKASLAEFHPSKSSSLVDQQSGYSGCGLGYTKVSCAVCPANSECEMGEYNHNSALTHLTRTNSPLTCNEIASVQFIPDEVMSRTSQFGYVPSSQTANDSALNMQPDRCESGGRTDYQHKSEAPSNQAIDELDCSVDYTKASLAEIHPNKFSNLVDKQTRNRGSELGYTKISTATIPSDKLSHKGKRKVSINRNPHGKSHGPVGGHLRDSALSVAHSGVVSTEGTSYPYVSQDLVAHQRTTSSTKTNELGNLPSLSGAASTYSGCDKGYVKTSSNAKYAYNPQIILNKSRSKSSPTGYVGASVATQQLNKLPSKLERYPKDPSSITGYAKASIASQAYSPERLHNNTPSDRSGSTHHKAAAVATHTSNKLHNAMGKQREENGSSGYSKASSIGNHLDKPRRKSLSSRSPTGYLNASVARQPDKPPSFLSRQQKGHCCSEGYVVATAAASGAEKPPAANKAPIYDHGSNRGYRKTVAKEENSQQCQRLDAGCSTSYLPVPTAAESTNKMPNVSNRQRVDSAVGTNSKASSPAVNGTAKPRSVNRRPHTDSDSSVSYAKVPTFQQKLSSYLTEV